MSKHIFQDATNGRDSSIAPVIAARRVLLSSLPRIIAQLTTLWQAVDTAEKSYASQHQPSCWIMGTPKAVKQLILEFLSPISHHHGVNFLSAVALTWYEKRRSLPTNIRRVMYMASPEQMMLVELVAAIKVMPIDTLVQTVRQVVKQPPPTSGHGKDGDLKKKGVIEVSMLQFFYAYMQQTSSKILQECWVSLTALMKEVLALNLTPPALFVALGILNEFVQRSLPLEDKKDQKELQDVAQKLIEACGEIAGAGLEQTTWLRRNLAVKPGPQADLPQDGYEADAYVDTVEDKVKAPLDAQSTASSPSYLGNPNEKFSVQALTVLAELLAPILDVVFKSDEKEKVIPHLNSIMHKVTPYLRNHSSNNVPSFRASSQLVASLSGYQYTRKSWQKDVYNLLLDPAFFQMEEGCLVFWQTIIDNLMTNDKVTFKDLTARVSPQPNSLNIFSSREQENEQRSQILKRLTFVLFCGEEDQYMQSVHEIQERLSESLRIAQVPQVQAQVFNCFRVLLLRTSHQHITLLWPSIITEMVQVFLQIEQELCADTEEFSSHIRRLSTFDTTWVVSNSNGLNAHNHPAWIQLYVSVCRLLDVALALPADKLPQFQMYRWAFVGDINQDQLNNSLVAVPPAANLSSSDEQVSRAEFVPHVIRLDRLMKRKNPYPDLLDYIPGRPLMGMHISTIKSIMDLQSFFHTLTELIKSNNGLHHVYQAAEVEDAREYIENLVRRDFVETLPSST